MKPKIGGIIVCPRVAMVRKRKEQTMMMTVNKKNKRRIRKKRRAGCEKVETAKSTVQNT